MKKERKEATMPSEYIQHLIDHCGAKPVPREQVEAFEKNVREKVIPAILKAHREQAIANHNMRVRPIPLPKGD